MLFAVFSASMLRPVELSWMVNRSPSSVNGLCSGAGIPPVWTHTHDNRHHSSGEEQSCPYWSVQTRRLLCGDSSQASDEQRVSTVTCRHHQQNTNTRPHVQYGQGEKARQFFKAVTVRIAAIWSWDDDAGVKRWFNMRNAVRHQTTAMQSQCIWDAMQLGNTEGLSSEQAWTLRETNGFWSLLLSLASPWEFIQKVKLNK